MSYFLILYLFKIVFLLIVLFSVFIFFVIVLISKGDDKLVVRMIDMMFVIVRLVDKVSRFIFLIYVRCWVGVLYFG